MRRPHFLTAVLAGGSLVLGALVSSTPSALAQTPSPTPPPPESSSEWATAVGPDFLANQAALLDLNDWVEAQNWAEHGWVALNIDPKTRSAVALHKNLPTALRATLEAEAARRSITLTWADYPLTIPELSRIQRTLMDSRPSTRASTGFQVVAVSGINPETPGITVYGTWSGKRLHTESAVATRLSALAGRPVKISLAAPEEAVGRRPLKPAPITAQKPVRWKDSSPFSAGGLMSGASDMICSSGFSVRYQGAPRVIVARHCKSFPYGPFVANGHSYGTHMDLSGDGYGRVLGGAGTGWTFDGAYNDPSGFDKKVTGVRNTTLGASVCTSGGNSGIHCAIRITEMRVHWVDSLGGPGISTVRGLQTDPRTIAVMKGDSGGPTFIPNADGKTVTAVGMIQGGGEWLNWQPPAHVPTLSSRWVLFTHMNTITSTLKNTQTLLG